MNTNMCFNPPRLESYMSQMTAPMWIHIMCIDSQRVWTCISVENFRVKYMRHEEMLRSSPDNQLVLTTSC